MSRRSKPGPPPITQYDEQIVALYAMGVAIERIPERVPVGKSTVKRRLLANGVTIRPRGSSNKQLDHKIYEETVRLYVEEELSVAQIAVRMNRAQSTITMRLRHAGVPLRGKSEAFKLAYRSGRKKPSGAAVDSAYLFKPRMRPPAFVDPNERWDDAAMGGRR